MIYETVKTINGKREIRRIKTSIIILAGLACFCLGVYLVIQEIMLGGALILTVSPCLLLYPLIRFIFFGGNDSTAAVVTTVVVEEAAKYLLKESFKDKKKKK